MKPRKGFCDNPLTQLKGLLPNVAYYMSMHGGLAKWKQAIPCMTSTEVQFLLFKEIPERAEQLQDYVKQAKELDIKLVVHAPFLFDKNTRGEEPKPFNVDYHWFVAPAEYKDKPVLKTEDVRTYAREVSIDKTKQLLDIMAGLGMPVMTQHVTTPGVLLSDEEWRRYLAIAKELDAYAKEKGVTVAYETGGVLENHLQDLADAGLSINFDPAHFFLDMRKLGLSVEEANKRTLEAFDHFRKHVVIIHLCQPTVDKDAHMDLLSEEGALQCYDEILQLAKAEGVLQFVTLETMPNRQALEHVDTRLEGKDD